MGKLQGHSRGGILHNGVCEWSGYCYVCSWRHADATVAATLVAFAACCVVVVLAWKDELLLALTAAWPKHSILSATHEYFVYTARRGTRSCSTKLRLSSTTARGGCALLARRACLRMLSSHTPKLQTGTLAILVWSCVMSLVCTVVPSCRRGRQQVRVIGPQRSGQDHAAEDDCGSRAAHPHVHRLPDGGPGDCCRRHAGVLLLVVDAFATSFTARECSFMPVASVG